MPKLLALFAPALILLPLAACSSQPSGSAAGASSEGASEATAQAPVVPQASDAVRAAGGTTVAAAPVPPSFRALGTEPFWSARVEGATLAWSTPEQPNGQAVPIIRKDEGGKAVVSAKVGGQALVLEVSPGACSDGMSDTVYPLTVTRRLGEDVQHGCAR